MLLANYAMAWFAQPGHATHHDDRGGYRDWIVEVIRTTWATFEDRFSALWADERRGILYPARLFEGLGRRRCGGARACASGSARCGPTRSGSRGVEIHRRTVGLAPHRGVRVDRGTSRCAPALQGQGLRFGRELVLRRAELGSMEAVIDAMRRHGAMGRGE